MLRRLLHAGNLLFADVPQIKGGLRDKPGKAVDYYHTCYCLSGLSTSQHYSGVVVGPPENLLAAADPLCNVVQPRLAYAWRFYSELPHGT